MRAKQHSTNTKKKETYMSFFPDNLDSLANSNSQFTKILEGNTKLRMLEEPVWGFEVWVGDDGSREVHRCKLNESIDKDILKKADSEPKIFCAVKVYNYNTKQIELWSFTQKQIINQIKGWADNEEYGDPRGYDIVINRVGTDRTTKYQIMANPPKPVAEEVQKASDETAVDPEALFVNASPFI